MKSGISRDDRRAFALVILLNCALWIGLFFAFVKAAP